MFGNTTLLIAMIDRNDVNNCILRLMEQDYQLSDFELIDVYIVLVMNALMVFHLQKKKPAK